MRDSADGSAGPSPTQPTTSRDRILDVAMASFAELGWRDSTVDTVCRRAGVTFGEFYESFTTVDDLFVEMYRVESRARIELTRSALRPLVDGMADSTPEAAIAALASALSILSADRDWWLITTEYTLRAVRHPHVAGPYLQLRRETHVALVAAVTEALDAAGAGDEVDVEQFVELTSALHRGAVTQHFLEPDSSTPQALDVVAWSKLLRPQERPPSA